MLRGSAPRFRLRLSTVGRPPVLFPWLYVVRFQCLASILCSLGSCQLVGVAVVWTGGEANGGYAVFRGWLLLPWTRFSSDVRGGDPSPYHHRMMSAAYSVGLLPNVLLRRSSSSATWSGKLMVKRRFSGTRTKMQFAAFLHLHSIAAYAANSCTGPLSVSLLEEQSLGGPC